jgi:hypothetical protein
MKPTMDSLVGRRSEEVFVVLRYNCVLVYVGFGDSLGIHKNSYERLTIIFRLRPAWLELRPLL